MGPAFFIDRPIFASVISIIIVLAGGVSLSVTPIAQYPEIAPPTVTISARYPGATAEVVANTVAAPIEQQVNGVDDMIYMTSTSSSSGDMSLIVTFEPGTDPDIAQVNTQNRVNQALAQLPTVVTAQGVTTQKVSQAFMMVVSFYSPDDSLSAVELNNYVNLYIWDAVKRLPGANLSTVFPVPDVAMRVWLRPDRLAQMGITIPEVVDAISGQNQAYLSQIRRGRAISLHAYNCIHDKKIRNSQAKNLYNNIMKTLRRAGNLMQSRFLCTGQDPIAIFNSPGHYGKAMGFKFWQADKDISV